MTERLCSVLSHKCSNGARNVLNAAAAAVVTAAGFLKTWQKTLFMCIDGISATHTGRLQWQSMHSPLKIHRCMVTQRLIDLLIFLLFQV